ncbi:hypothetical protein M758_7G011400 [Ceratodon purpureus]|nr:hypothetical protein M758_7G011400 [Ceratodon purpureus]
MFLACGWDGDDWMGPALDQDWSAGLSGHITVDLKEFYDDVDAEIYLEYPLFSSGAYNVTVRRTAKLEMSILCTCSTKTASFSNQLHRNPEYMGFEDTSKLRPSPDDLWYSPVQLHTESSHDAQSVPPDSALKQVSPANLCLVEVDKEIEMLKEMEGDLIELNSKLNKYVAAQSLKKCASGPYTSNTPSRPEALAAMFFAAGMAFQRQVDSVNRRRMYRGAEDLLLPGENRRLLLEDVSPTFRSEASANSELQEVDTFRQASSRSLVLSEGSTRSGGRTESWSCSSEATTSMTGDMDEDENYFHSPLRSEDMPMAHPDPELVGPRTSKSTCSPLGESITSMETISLVKNESGSQRKDSTAKYNVLNVVGSVLHTFAIVGLPNSRSKEIHPRGSEDDQVNVPGSMLGRQQVSSIQTIRKSNPGLGWLSNSMQS